ncbi:alpha/beta hydrolase [Paenibacillus gansuensis]|uniref:Alpha/beta hydrolase n=1 Tax=Paenibacillus gansuensis TaxID=306542 RepID=A0ABW5PHC4_9BACL
MERIYKTPDPFFLDGHGDRKRHGVLLIHGFTGSPAEHRKLGYFLNDEGYTVNAVQLPGHGKTPEEMSLTGWNDWWGHAKESFLAMEQEGYDSLNVVGYSMGGLLGLKLAQEFKVNCMISLAAPIFVNRTRILLAALVNQMVNSFQKGPKTNDFERMFTYSTTPIPCVFSLQKLMQQVKSTLAHVKTPLMVAHGMKDVVVHPRSASYIYHNVSSPNKKLVYYPYATHGILHDSEHENVYRDIVGFLQSAAGKEDANQLFRVY